MAQMTITAESAEVLAVLDGPWEMGEDMAIASAGITAAAVFPVRGAISEAFWMWYEQHAEDVIFKKRLLLWNVEVRVKHLRPVFDLLFAQGA